MIQRTQTRIPPSIHIRAVDPWKPHQGEEAGHLDLSPIKQSELSRVAEVISFEKKGSQIIAQGHVASPCCR